MSLGDRPIRRVAILGAGNGGCAAAADLTQRGYEVRLTSRQEATLLPIQKEGGILLEGALGEGFVRPALVSLDLSEVIRQADLIMLVLPTHALGYWAERLAPLLVGGERILLNPGHTGGALYFVNGLVRTGVRRAVQVGEFHTLSYSCRLQGPAKVRIFHGAKQLLFAGYPGKFQEALAEGVLEVFPQVVPAKNVLETGLHNINAVEHPPQILLNAGWIEHSRGDYYFYYEGTTPSVGRVIDRVDEERLALARALHVKAESFVEMLYRSGYTTEEGARSGSAHVALQHSESNRWIKGPKDLNHRYVHEDVGAGLIPWSELARGAAVPTPTMDSLIHLASTMNQIDYRREGVTLEKMGLAGARLEDLEARLHEGPWA